MFQSFLELTQNNELVSLLIGLLLLTIFIIPKTYAYIFSFVLAHISLVCGGPNNTTNHFTMNSTGGGQISVLALLILTLLSSLFLHPVLFSKLTKHLNILYSIKM